MPVSMKKIKAIIAISQEANRILNIVKAKHDLKTKSEAIEKMIEEYLKHVPHSYHKSSREREIKRFRELYG